MADAGTPRIRRAPVPDDAVFVVRGDLVDPERLRRDATRFHRRFATWRRYAQVDALCETKLINVPTVAVFLRAELAAIGIDVVPTFRTPHVACCG